MSFPITTAQIMKSVAGAGLFLLDPVSCRLTGLFSHLLEELVNLAFWGLLAGFRAYGEPFLGYHLYLLGCPLEMVHSLQPLLHLLGRAV